MHTWRASLTTLAHLVWLQVFELDHGKAWRAVLTSIVSMAVCEYLISIAPWYLLPFAWALAGTAFTGVSLIGDRGLRQSGYLLGWQSDGMS